MPMEIEAKFRLVDPEAMRRRLRQAGAHRIRTVLEHDTYFDTPDGDLRRSDRGLRVRVDEPAYGHPTVVLTHKGPRRPGELKVRPEGEVVVDSYDSAAGLLESMGFRETLSFQKRRETYRLAGTEVVVDELPELGAFLEIEGPDEQTVQSVRRSLGLEDQPVIPDPYVALVAERLAGREGKALKF